MTERRRVLWLVLIMMAAVAASTGVAITLLYNTAFEQTRVHLVQTVHEQAQLMAALVRSNAEHHRDDPEGLMSAALEELGLAFAHLPEPAQAAAIAIARREGDAIVYLVSHGRQGQQQLGPVPFDSEGAEPMRRALFGDSGSMIGLDRKGVRVLAAYQPLPTLGAGLVAKIDLADLRAPFLQAGMLIVGLALVLVSLGTLLFTRLTTPIVQRLTESEQRYRRLFQGAPVPIWELDLAPLRLALGDLRSGGVHDLERHLAEHPQEVDRLAARVCVKAVNHAALRLFGAGSEQQFRDWFVGHLLPASRPLSAEGLRGLWAGRETLLQDRVAVATVDGRELGVILSTLIPSAADASHSVPVAALDVTADEQLKRRQAELVQAQKMEVVGQLSGAVAHDFNNLLAIILSNLRFLHGRCGADADAELGEILGDALSAAEDGAVLTRRLLAFARQQPLEPQWFDLDLFIEHTGRFLRRLTGKDIELVVRRTGGALPVRVDRQQFESVLLNLAINARDAMPAGGRLTIDLHRHSAPAWGQGHGGLAPGRYALVRVSDTGTGMSPETLARACEPFYSTKPMGKGSGLGLSTALSFARQSGGDLRIESALGQGTSVSLYLPEAAPDPAESDPAGAGSAPGAAAHRTPTILVVDDDERIRRFASRALAELGHRVMEAESAAAAIGVLEANPEVELVLSDIVMPGEPDGLGLARWVQAHRPGLRVLLTSAFPPEPGLAAAAGAFLAKPFTEEQLRDAVDRLLEPSRP